MDQENDQVSFTSREIMKSDKEMNYIIKMRNTITFQIEEIEGSRRYIQQMIMKNKELKYFVACMKRVLHADSLIIENYSVIFKNINKNFKINRAINTNDTIVLDHQSANEQATIKDETIQLSETAQQDTRRDFQTQKNDCHILGEQMSRCNETLQQPMAFEGLKNSQSEVSIYEVNAGRKGRDSIVTMQGKQQLNSAESLSLVESRNTKPFPSTIREPCEQKMRDSSLNKNNSKSMNICVSSNENVSQYHCEKVAENILNSRKLTSTEKQPNTSRETNFIIPTVSNYSKQKPRRARINKIFSDFFLYKLNKMWIKSFVQRIDFLKIDHCVFSNNFNGNITQLNAENSWSWRRTYSNCLSLFSCNNKDFCVFIRENKGNKQPIHVFDQIMRRETGDYFDKISVFKTIVSPYYYVLPNPNTEENNQFLYCDDWIKKQDPMEYVLVMFFTFPKKIACTEVEEEQELF